MVKSNITLYGDTAQSGRLKDAGWNLSRLFKSTMDLIESQEYEDANILLKVGYYEDEIGALEAETIELRAMLYVKSERLERIRIDKEKLLKDWEVSRKTVRMMRLTKQLNPIVINCQYDIEMIRNMSKEILSGIAEVNPDFNLDRHVKRLQALMNS